LVLSTKRLLATAKFLVEATKNSFDVPDFFAVTKLFFSVIVHAPIRFRSAQPATKKNKIQKVIKSHLQNSFRRKLVFLIPLGKFSVLIRVHL